MGVPSAWGSACDADCLSSARRQSAQVQGRLEEIFVHFLDLLRHYAYELSCCLAGSWGRMMRRPVMGTRGASGVAAGAPATGAGGTRQACRAPLLCAPGTPARRPAVTSPGPGVKRSRTRRAARHSWHTAARMPACPWMVQAHRIYSLAG